MVARRFSRQAARPPAGPVEAARALVEAAGSLDSPEIAISLGVGESRRRFSIYEPLAAFDLRDELDFLTARAIETVPFYAPQFLVPAMPRLDDRQLRLLVARDENESRSRLRLLMPFSVEPTGLLGGPSAIRAWTHPFGPRGTVEVDHDDPAGTVASLFDALVSPRLALPPLFVVPDLRLDGAVAETLQREAARRGLSTAIVERRQRACLDATADPETFLATALSARRRRELRRVERRLAAEGAVTFTAARTRAEARIATEEFLSLEASGWKGRARSALLVDRYRAAFAREALDGLAACDRVRIYTLRLAGRPVASAVVLLAQGEAVLWKMAYDERHRTSAPGFQLLVRASLAMLEDPAIQAVDSCAVPDHRMVNRLWRARLDIGTLVIGLRADEGRSVRRAVAGLERQRRAREAGWRLRSLFKALARRS